VKQLKIGIVGTKFIADLHMISFQKLNQSKFKIHGVTSGYFENARKFAADHDLPKTYHSYEEMLADSEIDVVDLCTPNDLHQDMVVAAATAGKHIICEKPLTGAFGPAERPEPVGNRVPKKELLQEALDNVSACKEAIRESGVTFCYAENWLYIQR
jgi:predicted dehydrogenase